MLAEMLVAMAIGAFLLVALGSVTSFLLRSHERIARGIQETEDDSRALAALAREIGEARPLRWAGRKGATVFTGTPGQVLFAREAPTADGLGRIEATRFEIRTRGGTTEILRTEAVLAPDAVSAEALAWQPAALLYAGASRVAFAYFMRLDGGGEALLDDWPAGDEVPAAVRLSFLPSNPDGRPLSIRVALPIDGTPACVLKDCRDGAAETDAGDERPSGPVDADDPLGWGRYAR